MNFPKTETIKATELNKGDKIFMEYGDEGNYTTGTVIEVNVNKVSWGTMTVITFQVADGRIMECCPNRYGEIDRVIA